MKHERIIVDNGQQMSAVGQQVLWPADHVIDQIVISKSRKNSTMKAKKQSKRLVKNQNYKNKMK